MANEDEELHLGDLHHDPKNARQHNPKNIGMIEQSLREVGGARSVVIDENNVLLAGNGVVEAAAAAGIERVRVVEADGDEIIAVRRRGLTPRQKTRLALFDNRANETSGWDAEVLRDLYQEDPALISNLWNDDEFRETFAALAGDGTGAGGGVINNVDAEPQLAHAEQLRVAWQTERGQLWQLGSHFLLCGDAEDGHDVERLLGTDRPLLMVTDPPYGVEYDATWRSQALHPYERAEGAVQNDDKVDWRKAWALFPGDIVYVWHSGVRAGPVHASLEAEEFIIRMQIVWAKNNLVISRGHYHHKHEPCFYAVRKGQTARWIGDRAQTSVWEIDKPMKSETGHSTQKPLECMEHPMRNHDSPLVYDPFCGSGTTVIAAERLGRQCRALELHPPYVAVILQRFKDATGIEPSLVEHR